MRCRRRQSVEPDKCLNARAMTGPRRSLTCVVVKPTPLLVVRLHRIACAAFAMLHENQNQLHMLQKGMPALVLGPQWRSLLVTSATSVLRYAAVCRRRRRRCAVAECPTTLSHPSKQTIYRTRTACWQPQAVMAPQVTSTPHLCRSVHSPIVQLPWIG